MIGSISVEGYLMEAPTIIDLSNWYLYKMNTETPVRVAIITSKIKLVSKQSLVDLKMFGLRLFIVSKWCKWGIHILDWHVLDLGNICINVFPYVDMHQCLSLCGYGGCENPCPTSRFGCAFKEWLGLPPRVKDTFILRVHLRIT